MKNSLERDPEKYKELVISEELIGILKQTSSKTS